MHYGVIIAGCSSLIGGLVDAHPPSALVVTHCMTPPQAYWIRYAQTEVIEVCLLHVPLGDRFTCEWTCWLCDHMHGCIGDLETCLSRNSLSFSILVFLVS